MDSLSSNSGVSEVRVVPSLDMRKKTAQALFIAGIVLLATTVIGGLAILIVIASVKSLRTGLKYVLGMQTNVLQMKEKKLTNCSLVGKNFRCEDNQGPQWANAITFIIKDEQEVRSLILSAQVTDAQSQELATLGITTVIAVQEDWELNNNPKNLPTLALSFPENVTRDVHRIADHTTIDVDGLEALADNIIKGLELGSVLVHCKSGRGRSAQAIVAYLMKYDQELNPEDAMDKVKKARRFATFSKKTIKVFEQFHQKLEESRSHPL